MSSSELPFEVWVEDRHNQAVPDAALTVFDGYDHEVARAVSRLSASLPRGLYTVRIEKGGWIEERTLRHDAPGTKQPLEVVRGATAVPVFDAATTHEYFEVPASEWSVKDTRSPILGGGGAVTSRLFVFLRVRDLESRDRKDLGRELTLRDAEGLRVARFTPTETKSGDQGWLALSAPAAAGYYVLSFAGKPSRDLGLFLPPDWSTQVFLFHDEGAPRLETAVVLCPRPGQAFAGKDRINQAIDAALAGLQQGRGDLPSDLVDQLLFGKFENLMLGLVGAHLELLRPTASPDRMRVILNNFAWLAPGAPDVEALRVATALRFGLPVPAATFLLPPMLRVGYEAVLRAAAEHPALIPDASLTARIQLRRYVDSPWTSWESLPLGGADHETELVKGPFDPQSPFGPTRRDLSRVDDELEGVVEFLRELDRERPPRRELRPRRPRSAAELARAAGVTVSLIERAKARLARDGG